MSWKNVLKYCEQHRNPPEPMPAKEEEKMAGAVSSSTPGIINSKVVNPRKEEEEDE